MYRHFGEITGFTLALLAVMAIRTGLPARASAQDAGPPPTSGAPGPDAGGIGGSICSCETLAEDDGLLHVCTDSYEREVCEQFSCARGTERSRGCPSRGVQLCCEMPKQGTQSRLYDDCTHPHCESGFRDQCGDFGGTVHEGDCDVSAQPSAGGTKSLCAVARPGAQGGAWAWGLLSAAVLALCRRRQTR